MVYSWDRRCLRIEPTDEHEARVLISLVATLEAYGLEAAQGAEMAPTDIRVGRSGTTGARDRDLAPTP